MFPVDGLQAHYVCPLPCGLLLRLIMLTDHTIRGNVPPAIVVSAPPVRSAFPRFLLLEVLVLFCMRKVCTPYKHCSVFRVQYIAIIRSTP